MTSRGAEGANQAPRKEMTRTTSDERMVLRSEIRDWLSRLRDVLLSRIPTARVANTAPAAEDTRSQVVCLSSHWNLSDAYWNIKPSLAKASLLMKKAARQNRLAGLSNNFNMIAIFFCSFDILVLLTKLGFEGLAGSSALADSGSSCITGGGGNNDSPSPSLMCRYSASGKALLDPSEKGMIHPMRPKQAKASQNGANTL